MSVEVVLESTATESEVNEVKAAFAAEGIEADVTASVERKGVGDFPWVIYITVEFGVFFAAFAKSAGEAAGKEVGQAAGKAIVRTSAAAGRHLKQLVDRLYEARRGSRSPKGSVVLRGEDVHEEVILLDDVTADACQLLLDLTIEETESRQLRWDPKHGIWRDAWDIAKQKTPPA